MMRRLILAALCALALPSAAAAQFTLTAESYTNCGSSTATCTAGAGATAAAGDLIAIIVYNRDLNDITSVSDGVNSGYTCPDGLDQNDGSRRIHACYFINSGAGTVTPVVTHSANSRVELNYQVWHPTGTVTFDASVEGTNTATTSHVTPTLNTGSTAALVLCGVGASSALGAATAGSGFTALTDGDARLIGQYDISSVASIATTCPITSTNSAASVAIGASFLDSGGGGGGGSCSGGLLLTGAGKCE